MADDIMQEGMIGLLKAVRKYEPDKNASFATFAEICVTTQMISAIRGSRRNKNKPLNTSVSLNEPESEGVSLGETLEANAADTPEEMLVFKDVIYYILNNGMLLWGMNPDYVDIVKAVFFLATVSISIDRSEYDLIA